MTTRQRATTQNTRRNKPLRGREKGGGKDSSIVHALNKHLLKSYGPNALNTSAKPFSSTGIATLPAIILLSAEISHLKSMAESMLGNLNTIQAAINGSSKPTAFAQLDIPIKKSSKDLRRYLKTFDLDLPKTKVKFT